MFVLSFKDDSGTAKMKKEISLNIYFDSLFLLKGDILNLKLYIMDVISVKKLWLEAKSSSPIPRVRSRSFRTYYTLHLFYERYMDAF
jgi:hypothetical protein